MSDFLIQLSLVISGVFILTSIFILVVIYSYPVGEIEVKKDGTPFISVLVAARNEENNIRMCLDALLMLQYPPESLEILVANDQSTDSTGEIIASYASKHKQIRGFQSDGSEFSHLKGKQRVLALLASQAKGDYFFMTDADTAPNPLWAKSLLGYFEGNVGLVAGTTHIMANSIFGYFQNTDWVFFSGMMNAFAAMGYPLTAVGNNMAVTRKAYESTGGYEKIPFSITEDYALFREIRRNGFEVRSTMYSGGLAMTLPAPNFKVFLHQRKRWLVGSWDLPWYWRLLLFFFGAFYFALVVMLFLAPYIFIWVFLFKVSLQFFQMERLKKISGVDSIKIWHICIYELFQLAIIPTVSIYFLWPGKPVWKGRKF